MDESTTVIVCDRWAMPLGQRDDLSEWFLDWVLRRPYESSTHITAGYAAYQSLRAVYPDVRPFVSAREYFGGMGCQSLMIQNMYAPRAHTVVEPHPLAARHLKALLGGQPGADVVEGDAFDHVRPAELVGLDFGNLTILQAQSALKPLLDGVFGNAPKAVVMTDIAGQCLDQQRGRYEKLLGHDCSTYAAYLKGLALWLERTYGYRPFACFHHHWSAVMALVPARLGLEPAYGPPPELPRGISLR